MRHQAEPGSVNDQAFVSVDVEALISHQSFITSKDLLFLDGQFGEMWNRVRLDRNFLLVTQFDDFFIDGLRCRVLTHEGVDWLEGNALHFYAEFSAGLARQIAMKDQRQLPLGVPYLVIQLFIDVRCVLAVEQSIAMTPDNFCTCARFLG